MPDALAAVGSLVPGVCAAVVVLAVANHFRSLSALAAPVLEHAEEALIAQHRLAARRRLTVALERAGWRDSPERVVVATLALSAGLAGLGVCIGIVLSPASAASFALAGAMAAPAAVALALRSGANQRRRRLARELAPLLELFVLELGGGGSALSALGSVTMQIDGELAGEIRRLLIASQVTGSAGFESRLRAYAELVQIPALSSLATILVASREYGTGVTQGVRALAADLRRVQRRELIAHSRRALNHVLFPEAVGVLLPFLAILLFPAVTSLQANLK